MLGESDFGLNFQSKGRKFWLGVEAAFLCMNLHGSIKLETRNPPKLEWSELVIVTHKPGHPHGAAADGG